MVKLAGIRLGGCTMNVCRNAAARRWASMRTYTFSTSISKYRLASKKKGMAYGFVTVRYEWELHAEAQTKGGMWLIQAVFPFKPIDLPTP